MAKIRDVKALATAIVLAIATSGTAMAATCSAGAFGKVLQNATGAAATCDAGSVNNDNPLPGQVNSDALFTFTDWLYAGKQNIGGSYEDGSVNVGFAISNGATSGTWSFVSDLFTRYTDTMLVMKSGSGNNTQATFVGYLLNSALLPDGTYSTPFFNKNNGNSMNISHMTAYVRGAIVPQPPEPALPATVPVPAAGLLMLSAMGGFLVLRRRKPSA